MFQQATEQSLLAKQEAGMRREDRLNFPVRAVPAAEAASMVVSLECVLLSSTCLTYPSGGNALRQLHCPCRLQSYELRHYLARS